MAKQEIVPCNWNGWCREYCKKQYITRTTYYQDNAIYVDEGPIKENLGTCIHLSHRELKGEN